MASPKIHVRTTNNLPFQKHSNLRRRHLLLSVRYQNKLYFVQQNKVTTVVTAKPLNYRIILSSCPLNSRRCCLSGHLRTLWWLPLISYSFWEINGGHYLDTQCCFIKPTANFLPMSSTLFASFWDDTCSYFFNSWYKSYVNWMLKLLPVPADFKIEGMEIFWGLHQWASPGMFFVFSNSINPAS